MVNKSINMMVVVDILIYLVIIALYNANTALSGSNICVGDNHSCFVTAKNKLYCWGSNAKAQTGSDTLVSIGDSIGEMKSLAPVATDVTEVTCGRDFTCFVKSDGIYCFGSNIDGQLGLNKKNNYEVYNKQTSKVSLPSATKYQVSSMNDFVCAIVDKKIYCWGRSNDFIIGGSPMNMTAELTNAPKQISVGKDHACYVDSLGEAYCFGNNNSGQLGISSSVGMVNKPTKIDITVSISAIYAGDSHTCVQYFNSNKVACFGNNNYYQLGDGSNGSKGKSSSEMSSLSNTTLLGSGNVFVGKGVTCMVQSSDNGIYCLGSNSQHAICSKPNAPSLGNLIGDYPPNNKYNIPLTGTITIATGIGYHHCATDTKNVYCWGSNLYGQLGIESSSSVVECTTSSGLQKSCPDDLCGNGQQKCTVNCAAGEYTGAIAGAVTGGVILAGVCVAVYYKRKKIGSANLLSFGRKPTLTDLSSTDPNSLPLAVIEPPPAVAVPVASTDSELPVAVQAVEETRV